MRRLAALSFPLLVLATAPALAQVTEAADAAHTTEIAKHNRYNVLLIAIDDLRPELGCYGAEYAQSPHLDRFARSALQFDRHYVQVPTCGASRYALLTGRSPAASGVTRSNDALYSGRARLSANPRPGAQSLPELFRRSGYHTTCVGKISHTPDGRVFAYDGSGDGRPEVPGAWDALPTPFGPWQRGWGIFFAYANGRHRESGAGDQDLMEFVATEDDDLPDGMLAATACQTLREYAAGDEPFFMGVGFFKPHLPFVATRADWEAFEGAEIPLPESPARPDTAYWHGSGEFSRYDAPFERTRPLGAADARTTRRAYFACVRYVDRCVGRVLDTLDETGLAESTIVVVWGDHGWHLGEQQIWGKHTPLELALRSVLMVRVPGMATSGTRTRSLAETIDLYPTLLEACRPTVRQTHHPLDGRSLLPILDEPAATVRDTATSYWGDAVSIRTPTHRLVARQRGEDTPPADVELYQIDAGGAESGRFTPTAPALADPDPELVGELLSRVHTASGK